MQNTIGDQIVRTQRMNHLACHIACAVAGVLAVGVGHGQGDDP